MRKPSQKTVVRLLRWTAPLLILLLLAGCSYFRRRAAKRQPYSKLSPPVAYELIRDNPEMLIVDLRPAEEYNGETGHIQRAKNYPLDRLPYRLLELEAFRQETFLVYCRAGQCGGEGMAVLLSSGFENVILLDGGIDAWIRTGFKTVLPRGSAGLVVQNPQRPLRPGEKAQRVPEVEVPELPPPPPPPPNLRGSAASRPVQGDLS
ncbi:MAG TPA: rhodanese-like domain-containing protein [Thermoanaerobaculia bacterium]|nr:rhodanese-like domain-containing protein [Thermoanaerobaculia bacterium]